MVVPLLFLSVSLFADTVEQDRQTMQFAAFRPGDTNPVTNTTLNIITGLDSTSNGWDASGALTASNYSLGFFTWTLASNSKTLTFTLSFKISGPLVNEDYASSTMGYTVNFAPTGAMFNTTLISTYTGSLASGYYKLSTKVRDTFTCSNNGSVSSAYPQTACVFTYKLTNKSTTTYTTTRYGSATLVLNSNDYANRINGIYKATVTVTLTTS